MKGFIEKTQLVDFVVFDGGQQPIDELEKILSGHEKIDTFKVHKALSGGLIIEVLRLGFGIQETAVEVGEHIVIKSNGHIERKVSSCQRAGEVSDGYHTFDELYDHRVRLFSSLMRAYPHLSWWSEKHHDGTAWDGWIIAGIDTPAGTVTYHLPVSEIKHLPIIASLPVGKEWDGHTADDVLERLKSLWGEGAQHSASNLPAHQQRVIDERAELEDRHGKLSIFLDAPLFQTLPEEDRALLSEQFIHMTDYLNVLTRRIDRF